MAASEYPLSSLVTCKADLTIATATQTLVDTIRPDFRHTEFHIEPFIKQELRLKLDADERLCRTYAETGQCPLGATCPQRHVSPSALNFLPPQPVPQSAHAKTVCKHWLRGLCKKGASCDFMHEYNLRKMPECWFFAKYGFCSNGDEVRFVCRPLCAVTQLTSI